MKKSILLIMLCISLASCIGIESDITLHNDGSGTITLTYLISPVMKELGRIGDEVKHMPLPVYKEDFEKLLLLHPGLSMKSHSVKEVDGRTIVNVTLSFQKVESLTPLGGGEDGSGSFSFQKSNDHTVFRQNLPSGEAGELDEDTIAMLTEYCSDYYFIYNIHAPRPIIEYTLGELSKDKKHLVYKTGIIDILQSKESKSIEIKW
ncbi:MAG: hypothetical protein JXB88_25280 [Spirochaetales bacterium]|nr:hypothetical protein [Spirochaetales bacterium]